MPWIDLCAPAFTFDPYNLRFSAGKSVWLISVDLPEPLTPVTQINPPSGICTSMFLRLFSRQPFSSTQDLSRSIGRRVSGVLISNSPVRYFSVVEFETPDLPS